MKRLLPILCVLFVCACTAGEGASESSPPLRVLAYNIKHGLGMDGELDLQRVADLIMRLDPDIVTLQEVDRECTRSGGIDQAAWLADACGMYSAFGSFMPYQGGDYGMAVLSRGPILDVNNLRLPDGDEPRTALAVRVSTPMGDLVVCGIHLYRTEAERLAQAETIIEHYGSSDVPVILAGDFNSRPGSPVMNRLAEVWEIVPKTGPVFTFPADAPDREIDFCLVRPVQRLRPLSLVVIDEPLVSDHRPLLLEVEVR